MNIFIFGLLVVGVGYYLHRRRSFAKYKPGAPTHLMEGVSSSMLLSEVDPTKAAQVHIVSLLVFEEKLRYVDFRDRFVENVIMTDPDSRFLYRMDCSSLSTPPRWTKPNDWHPFDNCSKVSEAHTLESLNRLVSDRLTAPLDVGKPLWDLQFLETFTGDDNKPGSAAMLTMHHSMGDGFTLCHQIMRRAAAADASMTMHQCYPFQAPVEKHHKFSLSSALHLVFKVFRASWKLLTLTPDPHSALRNSVSRRMDDRILTDMSILPTSVDDLKAIARKASEAFKSRVYLNDVVVAACTLALGDLMEKKHDVTSAIWIGLNRKSVMERPKHRRFDWGNENLGACYLSLPTGSIDPLEVLRKCHWRLSDMKHSPEPLVANRLLALLGSVPLWILWPFRNLLMDKMSGSISNFPGPVHKIKLPVAPDGADNKKLEGVGTVKATYFWVAPPFKYGPYVTIASYCGKMHFALSANEKLMPHATVSAVTRAGVPGAIKRIEAALDEFLLHPQPI